jgi:hypothetical protein
MPAPNRAARRNAARTERIRNVPAPRELTRVRANRTFTPGHRGRR